MVMLFVGAIATATIVQGAFDASDHQKSERAVRTYQVGDGPPLGDRIEKEAPGGVWSSEITHACRGIVRVSYVAPGGTWVFDYDVPGHGIHPGNETAAHLLESLPPPTRTSR
jgi:hypothetical protein